MSLIRINMIIIDRNATYYDYDYDYTYYDRHIFEFESEYIETRPSEWGTQIILYLEIILLLFHNISHKIEMVNCT